MSIYLPLIYRRPLPYDVQMIRLVLCAAAVHVVCGFAPTCPSSDTCCNLAINDVLRFSIDQSATNLCNLQSVPTSNHL